VNSLNPVSTNPGRYAYGPTRFDWPMVQLAMPVPTSHSPSRRDSRGPLPPAEEPSAFRVRLTQLLRGPRPTVRRIDLGVVPEP
jgi:hypothetical protein